MAEAKVKVSQAALMKRINRRLEKRGEMLRKCPRNSRAHLELGDYYVVDFNRNFIVSKNHDLAELGRELDALRGWEDLAKE